MEIGTIKIAGMQGQPCADKVQAALAAANGVESAKVSLGGKRASVNFNAQATDLDTLKQVVVDSGFEIVLGHGEDGSCCGGCGG